MAYEEVRKIEDWIGANNGYDYYRTYLNRFSDVEFYADGNTVLGIYKKFQVLEMYIEARQVYLYADGKKREFVFNQLEDMERIAQKKLDKKKYKITRDNNVEIEKYLDIAKTKIDLGFKDFSEKLKKQKIDSENAVFLKIELNRAFTFSELSNLLLAYNQLYSLSCYIEKYGIESLEDIDSVDKDELWYSKELVLDSLHIASPGILSAIANALDCAAKGAELSASIDDATTSRLRRVRTQFDTDEHIILSYDEALDKFKDIHNPAARAYMESHLRGMEIYLDKNVGHSSFDGRA